MTQEYYLKNLSSLVDADIALLMKEVQNNREYPELYLELPEEDKEKYGKFTESFRCTSKRERVNTVRRYTWGMAPTFLSIIMGYVSWFMSGFNQQPLCRLWFYRVDSPW